MLDLDATPRTIVWFSAGAASAVAAKLTLAEGPAVLAYTNPGSEHPDNERFIADCSYDRSHVRIVKEATE
jgi:hypothetical protein